MTNKNPTPASAAPSQHTPETAPDGTNLAGQHVADLAAVHNPAEPADQQPGLAGTAAPSAEDEPKRPEKKEDGRKHASSAHAGAGGAPKVAKSDAVLKLLRRKNGAPLSELQDATGWQAHSVRAFVSGTVKKKLGLNVASEVGKQGVRRYRITTIADAS